MPSDFHRLKYRLPKYSASDYRVLMHSLKTALGFNQSEKAKFKLHCIEFFEKHGYGAFHDAFPQISRASIYRWRKDFVKSRRKLRSLVPKSTRPHKVRQMTVPGKLLSFLKATRQQYPHLSKYKLKPFLDEWCEEQGLPEYSVSWIGKVLNRYQLFFGKRVRVIKRRRQSRSGYTIKRTPNPKNVKLGYLQLDGIKVYWLGEKILFLTALELKTRTAWVKIVPTFSSHHASLFLKSIIREINYPLHSIHTDNGSEFKALFDKAVVDLELTHLWSPPRSPKIHSHIERFNGVIQEEFIDYYIDTAFIDRRLFQSKLDDWITWYNNRRPHHSLKLMTPNQYLLNLQKGVDCLKCP